MITIGIEIWTESEGGLIESFVI